MLVFYSHAFCIYTGFTEEDCLELYQKAITENPTINLYVAKAMTIGSPRVGKTYLRYLLLRQPPPTVSESTPVMKTAETVGILPITEQLSEQALSEPDRDLAQKCSEKGSVRTDWVRITSEDKWVLMNEASGLRSLLSYLKEHIELHSSAKPSSHFSTEVRDGMEVSSGEKEHDIQAALAESIWNGILPKVPTIEEDAPRIPSTIPEAVTQDNTSTARQLFQLLQHPDVQDFPILDAKLLQFLDCGGQLAYHDILPLFTTIPSIYLHVFNLLEDLDDHPKDRIQISDEEEELYSEAISPVTTAQMITRSLMTIRSLTGKKVNLPVHVLLSEPSEPCVILVGTHLDVVESRCTKEQMTRKQKQVNTALREAMASDAHRSEEMVLKNPIPPLPSMFIPVNNKLFTKEDVYHESASNIGVWAFHRLRKRIKEQISCVNVKVPVKWYLYQLMETSQSREGCKPVYRYCELYESCRKELAVTDVGEFHTMVTYFNALGLFVHLCGEDVKHTEESACFVFTNPTYLSETISKLYQVQFLTEDRCERGLLGLKRLGLLTKRSLQDLQVDEAHLKHSEFMDLLVQLYIGAEVEAGNGDKGIELFIPSVLMQPAGGHSSTLHLDLQGSQPHFVITFKNLSFIPCGVFTGAITRLLSVKTWKILQDSISRIHILFAVGARDKVRLFDCATHITVVMTVSDEQKAINYRNTILDAIAESYCFLFHSKTSKDRQSASRKECLSNPILTLGLTCHACKPEANHIAELHLEDGNPETVRCQKTCETKDLEDEQRLLFQNMEHYVSVIDSWIWWYSRYNFGAEYVLHLIFVML